MQTATSLCHPDSNGEHLPVYVLRLGPGLGDFEKSSLLDTFFQAAPLFAPNQLSVADKSAGRLLELYSNETTETFLIRAVTRAIGNRYQRRSSGAAPRLRAY